MLSVNAANFNITMNMMSVEFPENQALVVAKFVDTVSKATVKSANGVFMFRV